MDKTIATTDTLQQDVLSSLFQKVDIVPGHSSASTEKEPEEVVPKVYLSPDGKPEEQPTDQPDEQPDEQPEEQPEE